MTGLGGNGAGNFFKSADAVPERSTRQKTKPRTVAMKNRIPSVPKKIFIALSLSGV
jgi:hypothetical protein